MNGNWLTEFIKSRKQEQQPTVTSSIPSLSLPKQDTLEQILILCQQHQLDKALSLIQFFKKQHPTFYNNTEEISFYLLRYLEFICTHFQDSNWKQSIPFLQSHLLSIILSPLKQILEKQISYFFQHFSNLLVVPKTTDVTLLKQSIFDYFSLYLHAFVLYSYLNFFSNTTTNNNHFLKQEFQWIFYQWQQLLLEKRNETIEMEQEQQMKLLDAKNITEFILICKQFPSHTFNKLISIPLLIKEFLTVLQNNHFEISIIEKNCCLFIQWFTYFLIETSFSKKEYQSLTQQWFHWSQTKIGSHLLQHYTPIQYHYFLIGYLTIKEDVFLLNWKQYFEPISLNNELGYIMMGYLYCFVDKQFETSLQWFSKNRKISYFTCWFHEIMAMNYLQLHKYDKALEHFSQCKSSCVNELICYEKLHMTERVWKPLQLFPKQIFFLRWKCKVFVTQHSYDMAVECYQKEIIPQLHKAKSEIQQEIIFEYLYCALHAKEFELVTQICKLLSKNINFLQVYEWDAKLNLTQREVSSLSLPNEHLENDKLLIWYNNLGICYILQKNLREAEYFFKKALQLKPLHLETRFNLCLLLLLQHRYMECIIQWFTNIQKWTDTSSVIQQLKLKITLCKSKQWNRTCHFTSHVSETLSEQQIIFMDMECLYRYLKSSPKIQSKIQHVLQSTTILCDT